MTLIRKAARVWGAEVSQWYRSEDFIRFFLCSLGFLMYVIAFFFSIDACLWDDWTCRR